MVFLVSAVFDHATLLPSGIWGDETMSLMRRIEKRRREDSELERQLRIKKNDPVTEHYGGIRYSRKDIEELEREKLPWRRKRRAT